MAHSKRPRNSEPLDPCTCSADGSNPLCGDKLTVYVRKSDNTLDEVACETDGCAISRASGSIMTTMVSGKEIKEVQTLIDDINSKAEFDIVIDKHYAKTLRTKEKNEEE